MIDPWANVVTEDWVDERTRRAANRERVAVADRRAELRATGGVLRPDEQRRVEPDDGDERRVGTITAEVPLGRRAHPIEPRPAPPDHPGWASELLVPPTEPTGDLIVARDLDALRHRR